MTFITPKTFDVGEVLSAVDMNVFVRDNTADLDARLNEVDGPNSFRFAGRRVITESVTFEKGKALGGALETPWARLFLVTLVGGGAAGGGCAATGSGATACGGGGGAGGYLQRFFDADSLDATTTITIGQGGSGVSNGTGGNGTATVFGTASAPGGFGGNAGGADAVGGSGGTPATPPGAISIPGEGGSSAQLVIGGRGGSNPLGSGGRPGNPAQAGTGLGGQGFGAGGGGAGQGGSQPARTGGAGTGGIVIIDVFR